MPPFTFIPVLYRSSPTTFHIYVTWHSSRTEAEISGMTWFNVLRVPNDGLALKPKSPCVAPQPSHPLNYCLFLDRYHPQFPSQLSSKQKCTCGDENKLHVWRKPVTKVNPGMNECVFFQRKVAAKTAILYANAKKNRLKITRMQATFVVLRCFHASLKPGPMESIVKLHARVLGNMGHISHVKISNPILATHITIVAKSYSGVYWTRHCFNFIPFAIETGSTSFLLPDK